MIFSTTWILILVLQNIQCKLFDIEDKNEMKKVLMSHSNILALFIENSKIDSNVVTLYKEVSEKGNKLAKLLIINCQESKKLCKQYKAHPKSYEIQHFHKGKFNKIYDRKFRVESILRFLEDPIGDIAWEEEDTAKDVIHAKGSQDLQKIVGNYKGNIPSMMLMFYAPWCAYCKQMKPNFAAAATVLKGKSLFIGINGDLGTTDDLKQAFNITGYPSVFLIQDGNKVFKYENENSKDALIKFVQNPTKPPPPKDVPWAEETNEIDFLTDGNFIDYITQHESVIVIFYAPWCGHCKALKPEIVETAIKLRKLKIDAQIAAVDSTEQKNISETFKITGFPTLKYFKNGEYMYDVNERSSDGLVKFLLDPKKPQEPKIELPWKDEESSVIHPSSEEFRSILKRYKHSLVMFYAPWCGHCKATKPKFTAAANQMHDNAKTAFIAVDCTDDSFATICASEGITGYPIFRYFNYGKNTSYSEYSLEREEDDFIAFMTNPSKPKLDARRHWRRIPGHEAVVILETSNFVQNIVSQKSGAFVMFYSPWCGHCVAMKPALVNAANKLHNLLPSCLVAAVDATSETNLAAQYKVTGFPTIIYFSPSGDWIKYTGERTEDAIVQFMMKKDSDLKYEDTQRKLKEEKYKKEAEDKKKAKEEAERKKIEAEKKTKEERKKIEAEKKAKEEEERKKIEAEKKAKEEEERKKIEAEKKAKEEEERKKNEAEKKAKEEERKKIETEKKAKEEEERKKIEAEKKAKEEEERKKNEAEKKAKEEERKKIETESKGKEEETENEFISLTNIDSFHGATMSKTLSIFYLQKDNKKSHVKAKLVKLLNKSSNRNKNHQHVVRYEVNCSQAVNLCDHLNLVDLPAVLIYKNGEKLASFVGAGWTETEFNQLLDHSLRDEL